MDLLKNLLTIKESPTTIFALVGIIILILFILKMRKVKLTTRLITQIGLALALGTVLKMFTLWKMPQGGSVTFGSMVPILLIGYFYGPEIGILTGFLFGLIDFILGPYILHPVQVMFDYILPFMSLGLTGYFRNNRYLGTFIAVFGRFVCHVISGVVFFAEFAKGSSPLLYSIGYNGSFLGVDLIICLVIMAILPVNQIYGVLNRKEAI